MAATHLLRVYRKFGLPKVKRYRKVKLPETRSERIAMRKPPSCLVKNIGVTMFIANIISSASIFKITPRANGLTCIGSRLIRGSSNFFAEI